MLGAILVFSGLGLALAAGAVAPNGQHPFDLQLILGFVIPKILEWGKNSQAGWLHWLSANNPRAVKWTSAITALVVGLGVHISTTGSLWEAGSVSFSWQSSLIGEALHGTATWLFQWLVQHNSYGMFWKKALPATQ